LERWGSNKGAQTKENEISPGSSTVVFIGKSFREKAKGESGGFKSPEVGIEGGESDSNADGEGGKVGVHPDLGRDGGNGGEFQPEFAGACGFGVKAADMGSVNEVRKRISTFS